MRWDLILTFWAGSLFGGVIVALRFHRAIANALFASPYIPPATIPSTGLGYGWRCPYCRIAQDEGRQTGIYWLGKPVCGDCAPRLAGLRADAVPAKPLRTTHGES